ncbi:hypothetical protein O2N63_06990 [Aliiroseovarius sp. KMU-50]|uniref:GNAT family N-acetyltransferase n=1 Tax=Aliiroseovarius salicola TaxID=3009082 RepID=A0ABT4W000_9RHOB|nr:hypothetical protein [Aliiroseovarius sp. KMU-50]MDA5093830.1 hypothetical protein [Aliiroseovarius sp. KMU-50]
MTIHDTFTGAQYVSAVLNLTESKGLRLEIGSDFEHYAEVLAKHRKEQALGQPFNPERHDLHDDNAFWILGWTMEGELVHTQAMRKFELGGVQLSDYLSYNFREFPPSGMDLDMERSSYRPGPGAHRITGQVFYHGELWVKPDQRFRGTGLPGILARFAMATCVLRWSPDHVFGFMPEQLAYRGLMEREGYMHSDPGALTWHNRDKTDPMRAFMVYMSHDDLSFLLKLPTAETLPSLAA